MGCSCQIDSYDGYGDGDLISERIVKARKPHKCFECGREIRPKEQYNREVFAGNGIDVYFTCMDCLSVRDSLFCSWYYGQIWEEVWEQVQDTGGKIPEDCISKMTPTARARICEIIENCWEGQEER